MMPVSLYRQFRSAFRWLLQLDRPAPPRSDAQIAAEQARNYRWNFTFNLLDGAFFWFGLSFISDSTIVPLFISKLTDSPLPLGIAAVISQASWFLPQLFTAKDVERLARKKPVVVSLGFFVERVPTWLSVVAAMLAGRAPTLALVLFLLAFAWRGLGGGVVATAWQDLIARCFPVNRRGRFWGLASFVGTGAGTLGSALSAWLLATFVFPTNFVYTFLVAAVFINLSWVFLAQTREPVQPVNVARQSNREFLSQLPELLRRDHNFRRFLIARLLLALGEMGKGFITVAALRRWDVPDSMVGAYTAAALLGQTGGNLAFGLLADRFGHKLCLELGALASLSAFTLAWLSPVPQGYYAVFALLGIAVSAVIISGILIVMEFCEPARRPTFTGLANTSIGLAGTVGPLLGVWLASLSYNGLFILSAALNLAGLIAMRGWVREPRCIQRAQLEA
jgi:MFS family permease